MTKTIIAPVPTPGRLNGRNTRKNAFHGGAPKLPAACNKLRSILFIVVCIGKIINGNIIYTIQIITPVRLLINVKGSSTIPSDISALFIIPLSCKRTIQLTVHTSNAVQNGSSTSSIINPFTFGGAIVITYATGYANAAVIAVTIAAILNVLTSAAI